MTRLTDGKKLIEVYMGELIDDCDLSPDITGDLLGLAYERYDYEHDAILISGSTDDFAEWAHIWMSGKDELTHDALMEAQGTEQWDIIRGKIDRRVVNIRDLGNVEE